MCHGNIGYTVAIGEAVTGKHKAVISADPGIEVDAIDGNRIATDKIDGQLIVAAEVCTLNEPVTIDIGMINVCRSGLNVPTGRSGDEKLLGVGHNEI